MTKKIVLLVSGGLDSSTVLAMLHAENIGEIYALSFNYSQNNIVEIEKIKKFIQNYHVKHHQVINIDLSPFHTSSLINKQKPVPKYGDAQQLGNVVPTTYVPARNTIFLSYALGYAEVIGANDIYIGAHSNDCANYPDCRSEYIESFETMANLATKQTSEGSKIHINAPLLKMTKAEIVKRGLELGIDYSNTISCYDPKDSLSCGECHACLIRLSAFAANNQADPIKYIRKNTIL
ncbi:MAG: 7-cyano-7-deazaguanine synthase QueC [Rickettsiaceae bacterium]|nr:7-cyano-7-deazaguanine synthase QueC [Rickettsiaceae bacterium]